MSNLQNILGATALTVSSMIYNPPDNRGDYHTTPNSLLAQSAPTCPVRISAEGPATETKDYRKGECPINLTYLAIGSASLAALGVAIGVGYVIKICREQPSSEN